MNATSRHPTSADLIARHSPAAVDGIYLHVPFCKHKCPYCDHYSLVAGPDVHEAFVRRLIGEMQATGPLVRSAPQTVYVGGGTPTELSPALWGRVLTALRASLDCSALREFTVETNPETTDAARLEMLVKGSVNRLSIGAQSFSAPHLSALGRRHSPADIRRAVELARRAGLDNLSLDLMFAMPGQTPQDRASDLEEALVLGPEHLSCYALTFERGTPLAAALEAGRVAPCPERGAAVMYERAMDRLQAAGFEHYEISNFARPGRHCLHNMLYWTGGNWLALGPAAWGHLDGLRWRNAPDLQAYLHSQGGAPVDEVEKLDDSRRFGEQIAVRLRVVKGVPIEWLEPRLDPTRRAAIERLCAEGLLERTPTHLRLTRRGLLLADHVATELL